MKKLVVFCVLLILIAANGFSNEKNVLVIQSYHQGLEWGDSIAAGILSVFNNYPEVRVHFEYLDTKRNTSKLYLKSFVELYRSRASNIKYDAIIAADNAAFDFMIQYGDEFYFGIPVFYCGVSHLDIGQLKSVKNFYGFSENPDHKGTIDLIRYIFPERKKVLVINDYTLTGTKVRQELEYIMPAYNNILEFEIFDNFNVNELKNRVSQLDDDYVIYLLAINKDRDGNYISFKHGIKIIRDNTTVPIFGSWDFYLGKGIIGGQITHGMYQGHDVALLAYNYISNIDTVPPIYQEGRTTLSLDYNILEQYNISKRLVPKNALFINKPKLTDKQIFWMKIGFAFIIASVLVYYYFQRRNQAKKLKILVELRTHELKTANSELEKINHSKNEILSIVAHDLRNPIANINGFSKLIMEDKVEVLSPNNKKRITYIYDLSNYMIRLVNNLLDISVIESGVLKLDKHALDYVSFIQKEVHKNRPVADQNNIQLESHYPDNIVIVNFDKIKMQQVINNLISNALKFSKDGGKIDVSVSFTDNVVITSVKDTGSGISKENFNKIFEKFTQLEIYEETKKKGAGLGLSIVKGIIEAHGGRIYVKSILNKGSEFIYELPLKR